MAEFIVMPKLGFDMREGVLNGWLKNIGDPIEKGDIVAEIESDKATLELEAQVSGVLLKILQEAGDLVPIGANVAIVGVADEDISGLSGDDTVGEDAVDSKVAAQDEAETAVSAPQTVAPTGEAISDEFPGGIKATPVARRLAADRNINLRQVNGSGPNGRIRKADVEAFVPADMAAKDAATLQPSTTPVPTGPETEEIPLTRLRQAIARRMVESKTTIPHFYVTNNIDMAPALALRKQINAALPEGDKVTVNDLIVKAAALALRQYPNINATFGGDKIVHHNRIHVGTAVAIEGGLMTVVQKNTDLAPLAQIARDNKAMIGRAREGRIKPDDVAGSTFTVSNLGGFDVDSFVAIINPPEAAILAVGSAQQVPIVVDGQLAIGTRMKATVSADHRVTDGAEAAQFMQTLKLILEEPIRLLL